jgi:hypothetical protein
MNLTDLAEVLRDRADVPDSVQQVRLAGVRSKVIASRRRRAVAGVACVVLALVGVVFAVVPRSGPSSEPAVPVRSFPEYQSGARLIAQAWKELPSTSVTVRFVPTSLDLRVFEQCEAGHNKVVLVDLKLNGKQLGGGSCTGTITNAGWALLGVVVGQPSELTMTVLGEQGEVVDGVPAALAMPAEVAFGLGVGQGVPVSDYPFPPRPQSLEPLESQYPEGFIELTADPADPAARKEVTFEWPGPLVAHSRMNTPGRIQVLVNDVPIIDYSNWTYTAGGSWSHLPDEWASSYGLTPAVGDPVRVTVIPERTTGDWEVKFDRR